MEILWNGIGRGFFLYIAVKGQTKKKKQVSATRDRRLCSHWRNNKSAWLPVCKGTYIATTTNGCIRVCVCVCLCVRGGVHFDGFDKKKEREKGRQCLYSLLTGSWKLQPPPPLSVNALLHGTRSPFLLLNLFLVVVVVVVSILEGSSSTRLRCPQREKSPSILSSAAAARSNVASISRSPSSSLSTPLFFGTSYKLRLAKIEKKKKKEKKTGLASRVLCAVDISPF